MSSNECTANLASSMQEFGESRLHRATIIKRLSSGMTAFGACAVFQASVGDDSSSDDTKRNHNVFQALPYVSVGFDALFD